MSADFDTTIKFKGTQAKCLAVMKVLCFYANDRKKQYRKDHNCQEKRYEVQLNEHTTIEDAWNSASFERFRDKMRAACPDCEKKSLCLGGCPLMPEIVFCESEERAIV